MHVDIVDSTTMVQRNTRLAHQRIQESFKLCSTYVRYCGGYTREMRGDALIACFQSASDAVLASQHIQVQNTRLLTAIDDAIKPALRIGIALGEVIMADNTITGDGVVLAQRLEQLAPPAGVCIQGTIYDVMSNRYSFKFRDMGRVTLKGYEAPVRAYRVTPGVGNELPSFSAKHWSSGLGVPSEFLAPVCFAKKHIRNMVSLPLLRYLPGRTSKPTTTKTPYTMEQTLDNYQPPITIAVLPFISRSESSPSIDWPIDIAEDIITDLSKLSFLRIITRHISLTLGNNSLGIGDFSCKLGVDYLLDGRILRIGQKIRVNVQLIELQTATEIWSERYTRDSDDTLEVQDEITNHIVNEIIKTLTAPKPEAQANCISCCINTKQNNPPTTPADNSLPPQLRRAA